MSHLQGEGKPLDLSEDLLVPAEIRTLMRVLKNAGYTPPEIALLKSIANVEKELAALPVSERTEKAKAPITKIALLRDAQQGAKHDWPIVNSVPMNSRPQVRLQHKMRRHHQSSRWLTAPDRLRSGRIDGSTLSVRTRDKS